MLKLIDKISDLLVPNSDFLKWKSPCKSAIQNKLFADVSGPAGYCVPSGPWKCICLMALYRTRRAKRPRREEKYWKW